MAEKYTHDELVEQVKSPGWALVTDEKSKPITGSLEDVLKATHERHANGEEPGLIQQIETTIELDMLQIEQLWRYLGLPV
jgi:hypothetical protein